MTSNLKKLYHEFIVDFENSPNYVLDFYTKNVLFLNNIRTFTDSEELQFFVEIVWQYLNVIYQKARFNETVDFADKTLKIIDSELIRLNANGIKGDWYNGIMHFKGMASYQLRDYKTSTSIYKYLTVADAKNDNFKNWLNHSVYGQRLWLVNTINVVSGILLLIYFFAKEYIELVEIRISILSIAFLGLLGNLSYEYYTKRSFRRPAKTK